MVFQKGRLRKISIVIRFAKRMENTIITSRYCSLMTVIKKGYLSLKNPYNNSSEKRKQNLDNKNVSKCKCKLQEM